MQYVLIDENDHFNSRVASTDFLIPTHEYLSRILEDLHLIIRVRGDVSAYNPTHLYVAQIRSTDGSNRFPYIVNRYRYSFESKKMDPEAVVLDATCLGLIRQINLVLSHNSALRPQTTHTTHTPVPAPVPVSAPTPKPEPITPCKLSTSTDDNSTNICTILDDDDALGDMDEDELAEYERMLEEAQREEEEALEGMKDNLEKSLEQLEADADEHANRKMQEQREKEREVERKRKFEVDKGVYFQLCNQIRVGDMTEDKIPPLFKDEWPIFKFMAKEDILDKDEEYDVYLELTKDRRQQTSGGEYVPHNLAYLSKEEQAKYAHIIDKGSDDIENMLKLTKNHKPIPTLDELNRQLDEEDEEEVEEAEEDADIEIPISEDNNSLADLANEELNFDSD